MLSAASTIKTRQAQKVGPVGERIAIIDLGTNSVRFDVYHRTEFQVIRIHREKQMIRLGDQVFRTGLITKPAMLRTVKTFVGFSHIIESLGVTKVRAFGTSALRTARNAKKLVKLIEDRSGISVKTISGSREGLLIAEGIFAHVNPPKKKLALVDIGGGSAEVSICIGKKVLSQISFKLGAARLRQMFLDRPAYEVSGTRLAPELALRQHIRKTLKPLTKFLKSEPCHFVIGSSGTVRSLVKILKKMNKKGQPASRSDLSGLVGDLRFLSKTQIAKIPGMEPKRVDLILAGAIVFEEILYFLGAQKFYATPFALRDGILAATLVEPRHRIKTKRV